MRTLLVLGHPRDDSLNAALWRRVRDGLEEAGVDYRTLAVGELAFEPDVRYPSPADQPLEPDLVYSQELLAWAEHIIFVYPTWWGTMPARLKGWLDRVLTPGFAFRFHERGGGWDQLLAGKTAELITTMDTPLWVYRWVYGAPGHRALARATLGFCGVRTVRITEFGPVHHASMARRQQWLARARSLGLALRRGALRGRSWLAERSSTWMRAMRLQFYPLTAIAYALGALAATGSVQGLNLTVFLVGYLGLFCLEAATVFTNELFDYESDRRNRSAGPFNGGSRVLVEGALTRKALWHGSWLMLAGFAASGLALLFLLPAQAGTAAVLLGILAVLALGYTVPPLKLAYRGLGELDVALTHSFAVVLCGYVFQGGVWYDPLPWLISLPLFLAAWPSITLSGVPDRDADAAAGKRTLAVRWGNDRAGQTALAFTLVTALAALGLVAWEGVGNPYGALLPLALLHAGVLAVLLMTHLYATNPGSRWEELDRTMVWALSFMFWFAVLPLIHFIRQGG